jgi:hypothetical protein
MLDGTIHGTLHKVAATRTSSKETAATKLFLRVDRKPKILETFFRSEDCSSGDPMFMGTMDVWAFCFCHGKGAGRGTEEREGRRRESQGRECWQATHACWQATHACRWRTGKLWATCLLLSQHQIQLRANQLVERAILLSQFAISVQISGFVPARNQHGTQAHKNPRKSAHW